MHRGMPAMGSANNKKRVIKRSHSARCNWLFGERIATKNNQWHGYINTANKCVLYFAGEVKLYHNKIFAYCTIKVVADNVRRS